MILVSNEFCPGIVTFIPKMPVTTLRGSNKVATTVNLPMITPSFVEAVATSMDVFAKNLASMLFNS